MDQDNLQMHNRHLLKQKARKEPPLSRQQINQAEIRKVQKQNLLTILKAEIRKVKRMEVLKAPLLPEVPKDLKTGAVKVLKVEVHKALLVRREVVPAADRFGAGEEVRC
jgi:hypothetical protein